MKKLNFKFIAAQNFLCFGPDGIELNLEDLSNIILVRGDNEDVQDEEERISSNGVGKSSIPEIIVYTLFGKTIKHPKKLTHNDVINNQSKKKLVTEVRWDKYRVVRTRKPNSLRIWESEEGEWNDDTEISLGGMPATQAYIEEIVGLSYETFVNVVVFTDSNTGSFMEMDVPSKRRIVENLLSLDKYRAFSKSAKDARNKCKETIRLIGSNYEQLVLELDASQRRIKSAQDQEVQWKSDKKSQLSKLVASIKSKRLELETSDIGAALTRYSDAQDKIKELNESIPDLEARKNKIDTMVTTAQQKYRDMGVDVDNLQLEANSLKSEISTQEDQIRSHKRTISNFSELKNETECPTCKGEVKEEDFASVLQHSEKFIDGAKSRIDKLQKELEKKNKKLAELTSARKKMMAGIESAKEKAQDVTKSISSAKSEIQRLSKIEKPEKDSHEKILEEQIESLKEQAIKLKEEMDCASPYEKIIQTAKDEMAAKQKECEAKKAELEEAEKESPYYEFWVKAFGDSGIRKFVIDEIIPALNSRIAYWLQFLIDGKIKLAFDNQLEETIERNPSDGDPFVYHAMSGGERRRLNLSVSQAFAHVMMLNTGTSPSLVFLDEVTTNIDPVGVQGVYNMIAELAKDKQVFVTTHDQDLLEMLAGCDSINLVKKNGFTKLV